MGTLKVLYTNADGLVNKRHDLKILLHSLNEIPDTITITEFQPKKLNHELLISEFNLASIMFFIMVWKIKVEEVFCFTLHLISK